MSHSTKTGLKLAKIPEFVDKMYPVNVETLLQLCKQCYRISPLNDTKRVFKLLLNDNEILKT